MMNGGERWSVGASGLVWLVGGGGGGGWLAGGRAVCACEWPPDAPLPVLVRTNARPLECPRAAAGRDLGPDAGGA